MPRFPPPPGYFLRPSVWVYRTSVREGWVGGNRFWRAVFVLILARRALRKIMGTDPITVAIEQIKPGETVILRGVRSRKLPSS